MAKLIVLIDVPGVDPTLEDPYEVFDYLTESNPDVNASLVSADWVVE